MVEIQTYKRGFKRKTIVQTIENKMNAWIKTLPESMREKVKNDYIVTGGAIASMLLGDLPNDYDIYFQTAEIAKDVAQHYLDTLSQRDQTSNDRVSRIEAVNDGDQSVTIMIKSAGVLEENTDVSNYQYFENQDPKQVAEYFKQWQLNKPKRDGEAETFKPAFISSNAITLHDGIQLIMRFCGDSAEIHKNFDYIHCTNWYTNNSGLNLNQEALEAILARELKYTGSRYPVCSVFRLRKFIRRGWTITAGEMFKISYDISKLDLDDYNTLRDQLVGVDAAYFNEILHILSKHEGTLDRTYLFEIINRVFEEGDE
jgi:hypothetical protein